MNGFCFSFCWLFNVFCALFLYFIIVTGTAAPWELLKSCCIYNVGLNLVDSSRACAIMQLMLYPFQNKTFLKSFTCFLFFKLQWKIVFSFPFFLSFFWWWMCVCKLLCYSFSFSFFIWGACCELTLQQFFKSKSSFFISSSIKKSSFSVFLLNLQRHFFKKFIQYVWDFLWLKISFFIWRVGNWWSLTNCHQL